MNARPAMKLTTIDLPALCVRAKVGSVNDDARTIEVIFSTGAAVDRWDRLSDKRYREVLSMAPAHVRLERLNAGAPVLDSHSAFAVNDILGTVVPGTARIEKAKGIATVRFSKRKAVEPIWQDVTDGILRNVSIGYRVHKFIEEQSKNEEIPTRTAVDWEPFEISMVPMPADVGAKVRGDEATNSCVLVARDPSGADADRLRPLEAARGFDWPELTPSADEFATVIRAYQAARAHGLVLPAGSFRVRWYDAIDGHEALGTCDPTVRPIEVSLRRGQGHELFETAVHEFFHVHDALRLGARWKEVPMAERERRADAFAFRVVSATQHVYAP